jgi:hypothetical protein
VREAPSHVLGASLPLAPTLASSHRRTLCSSFERVNRNTCFESLDQNRYWFSRPSTRSKLRVSLPR